MKTTSSFVVGLALAGALSAAPAQAQNVRSFVSGLGSDTNSCSIVSPCKTFQGALSQTNAGGQIIVLDSAGYGGGTTVMINKPISIINQSGFAGVSVPSGGTGILIAAGSGAVNLLGLTIDGFGSGHIGIQFNTGASLTIENCVVRNLGDTGIDFEPNASSNLAVLDTYVANTAIGIHVLPSGSGAVTAVFNRVEADNNQYGIIVNGFNSTGGKINATAIDSVATGNTNTGFYVKTQSGGAPTNLMMFRSVAANNTTGITADATGATGATLWIGQSTVTGNIAGWSAPTGGVVQSYGTNQIVGNGSAEGQAPGVIGGSN